MTAPAPRSVWLVAWPDGHLVGPYRSEAEADSYRGRWPTAQSPAVIRYQMAGLTDEPITQASTPATADAEAQNQPQGG